MQRHGLDALNARAERHDWFHIAVVLSSDAGRRCGSEPSNEPSEISVVA